MNARWGCIHAVQDAAISRREPETIFNRTIREFSNDRPPGVIGNPMNQPLMRNVLCLQPWVLTER